MARQIGTTSEEVETLLGMKHQTVSARRTDLRANGYTTYLMDNASVVRRKTNSGKSAIVEIATQRGKDAIRHNTPLMFDGRDPTRPRHRGNPASSEAFNTSDFTKCARAVLACMCKFTP